MIPTFGGIELLSDASALVSGAAFNLERPSRADGLATVGGVRYEVRRRGRVVVARGAVADSYEGALRAALGGVQEALDLWSLAGIDDLSITGVAEDHLAWWPIGAGLVVRVVSLATVGLRLRGHLTVAPDDDLVREERQAAFSWHPSLRYFRLSQSTDDLVDSFRCAFLALESILSSIAPQAVKQNGRKETEAEWFKRAIGQAGKLVDLALFAPSGRGDLSERVFQDLNRARTTTFHAKVGRSALPLDPSARTRLAETSLRSVRLYLALADKHLGARRPQSGLSEIAFRTYSSSLLADVVVWASGDETPFDRTDVTVNPSGMPAIELGTLEEADDGVPFLWRGMASASATELDSLGHIRRVVAASPAGTPVLTQVLEERLVLGSASRLEVVFGIRHRNEGPRLDYLT